MKVYTPSLKRQIKECILALIWPKKEILGFFKDCSVPQTCLSSAERHQDDGLSRAAMIDRVFESLALQPGGGTMHFGLMLECLTTWSYFDPFWFDSQKTLDKSQAVRSIERLRLAKEGNTSRITTLNAKRTVRETARRESYSSLEEMRAGFNAVATQSGTVQARGFAFEIFLGKMARYFDLNVTSPFRINGTQIDGTVKFDGENYIVEAKWHDRSLSDEPILAFCHKQGMNMHGRGIFISINGYTEGVLSMLERGSVKNTVLMDGEDIALVLDELVSLPEVLDKKVHAAQTRGQFYIHPITGQSKILSR